MTQAESSSPNEELRHLQETMLRAVLLGEPLPGRDQPVVLPDLPFVLQRGVVFVVDENLAEHVSTEDLPVPVRIVTTDSLREEARSRGDTAYLRFQPAEREGDTVRLTLQAGIVPQDPDRRVLGLSGAQVSFRKVGDRWEAISDPSLFAT